MSQVLIEQTAQIDARLLTQVVFNLLRRNRLMKKRFVQPSQQSDRNFSSSFTICRIMCSMLPPL